MDNEPQTLAIQDWTLKAHIPKTPGPHPVFLLNHGWTGDENSMWIFGSQLSKEALIFSPRAPHLSNHPKYGGYSWTTKKSGDWSTLDDLYPSIQALESLIGLLSKQFEGDYSQISLAGFSQGAALSFAYALIYPHRVKRIAGLAGFIPEKCEDQAAAKPLQNIPILIAHGAQDETVPIEKAHHAQKLLALAGANITYCESDVGHKLGANCFKVFKEFMAVN